MKLSERLKKIEAKAPEVKQIIVVKFSSEIRELSCGDETFVRTESESEKDFIERVEAIFELRLERPMVTVLVGNF